MATFKDRDVFEFCEKLFEKLKKQDNGYFPHRHDKQVFDKAAEHFSISVDEVDRIYDGPADKFLDYYNKSKLCRYS